jgi:RIB43A
MSSEQIADHKLEQEKQLHEMQQRRIDEQNKIKQWENFNQEQHRQMCLQERSISKSIRQMNHKVREENENLAVEQKFNGEEIKKVLDTNIPSDEYFDQFNTTSR